jgi:hypothetical protein
MKKSLLLIFLFATTSFVATAQTYNMGNTTVTSATGTLYDSGGAGGNYLDNEDYTFTICPSGGASCINLIFASLSLETCCDYIRVYDGSNAGGILLGQYNGAALPPTLNALSGCLTVVFPLRLQYCLCWLASIVVYLYTATAAPSTTATANKCRFMPVYKCGSRC